MKKYIFVIFFYIATFLVPKTVIANEVPSDPVSLSIFFSTGCPHCLKEREYLQDFAKKYPEVELRYFEVSTIENSILFRKVGEALKTDTGGVPFTVICDQHLIGFRSAETTGVEIETLIEDAKVNGCIDVVKLAKEDNVKQIDKINEIATFSAKNTPKDTSFDLPILGTVQAKQLSLPILTIVIAFLDGFNPCAMWVLLFLISMLLGMKDRKKMWILGGAFIFTSALMYGLFMTAWLNVFLFIGYVHWVQLIIGLFSLAIGVYYLRDYCINKSGGCSVTDEEQRKNIFSRIKKITHTQQLRLALLGICSLAIAVNIIELVCSAGLPAVYTSILSQSSLPIWQYYIYILLYLLIFMIDDLIIFILAMVTFKVTGIENKYARLSHLIGGVVMVLIGLAMLFKPELLMMG